MWQYGQLEIWERTGVGNPWRSMIEDFGRGGANIKLQVKFGGIKTIGVTDRLTKGKPTWWNLNKIFEILDVLIILKPK